MKSRKKKSYFLFDVTLSMGRAILEGDGFPASSQRTRREAEVNYKGKGLFPSSKLDGVLDESVLLQVLQLAVPQGRLVRALQHNLGGRPALESLLPAARAEAPEVPGPEAREAVLRRWAGKVVPPGPRELEESLAAAQTSRRQREGENRGQSGNCRQVSCRPRNRKPATSRLLPDLPYTIPTPRLGWVGPLTCVILEHTTCLP